MLLTRIDSLTSLIQLVYKTNGELEDALGVANANVKVVMMNCEMLEEALRREAGGSAREVGWRRGGTGGSSLSGSTPKVGSSPPPPPSKAPLERSQSVDVHPEPNTPSSEGRFFKFRFNSSANTPPAAAAARAGASLTRPSTPSGLGHLNSPSLPVLPLRRGDEEGGGGGGEEEEEEGKRGRVSLEEVRLAKEREREEKERTLLSTLESERKLKTKALAEKAELEAELESLSQALFEEANKMVADERRAVEEERSKAEEERRRAEEMRRMKEEREEEVEELRKEKEALRSALRVIEGENVRLSESMRIKEGRSSISTLEEDGSGDEKSSVRGMKSPPKRRISDLEEPSPWADS